MLVSKTGEIWRWDGFTSKGKENTLMKTVLEQLKNRRLKQLSTEEKKWLDIMTTAQKRIDELHDRQQKLNAIIHRLLRVSEIYNVAVIVTNQVQSTPDVFFGDPTKPAGGNVIAHACTYRIYLRKSGQDRTSIMMDSPYHPYSDTRFRIFDGGVENAEPKKK